jgi:HEAT repeat protein
MASPSRKLEEKLAALKTMERSADAPDAEAVRDALRSKTGLLVAAAARLVASRELRGFLEELPPAFVRLTEKATERDPGCRGKIAIAKALQALDVLADLLADPQRAARAAAAQALGDTGRPDASALLRYKVRIGDPEPDVIAACLGSLLALAPRASLPFFASLLKGRDERASAAALALGESRIAAATPLLVSWCEEDSTGERRQVGYLSLALLRDETANEYLLGRLREAEAPDAISAGKALATFRDDARLAARVREAAKDRDRAVVAAIEAALR